MTALKWVATGPNRWMALGRDGTEYVLRRTPDRRPMADTSHGEHFTLSLGDAYNSSARSREFLEETAQVIANERDPK